MLQKNITTGSGKDITNRALLQKPFKPIERIMQFCDADVLPVCPDPENIPNRWKTANGKAVVMGQSFKEIRDVHMKEVEDVEERHKKGPHRSVHGVKVPGLLYLLDRRSGRKDTGTRGGDATS